MNYFWVSDEHYFHTNIIRYTNRPFENAHEMNKELIRRHNEVTGTEDRIIHCGDFTLENVRLAGSIITQLNGKHTFLRGSHDYWLPSTAPFIWEKTIDGIHVVACHYAMRSWPRSHYGSIQAYGHSHGKIEPLYNQWDIGVDNNNYYPVSFEQLINKIEERKNEKT